MQHVHTKYCPKAKVCEKLKTAQKELTEAKKRIKYLEGKLLEDKKPKDPETKTSDKCSAAA